MSISEGPGVYFNCVGRQGNPLLLEAQGCTARQQETHSNSSFPSEVLPTPRVETCLLRDETMARKMKALANPQVLTGSIRAPVCVCVSVVAAFLTGVPLAGKLGCEGSKRCRFLLGTVVRQEVHNGCEWTAVGVRSWWLANMFLCVAVCIPFQMAQTLIKIP